MLKKAVVTSMNIYSLKKHFQDMKSSSKITTSDVICIQETWMEPEQDRNNDFQINGFNTHFNSIRRGKGILTYFTEKYSLVEDIKENIYQITKISSIEQDIINVYRSSNAPMIFVADLKKLINTEKETHIIGDFNICYKSDGENKIVKTLKEMGFR